MDETIQQKPYLSIDVDQPGIYQIRVRGQLSDGARRRFTETGLSIEISRNGDVFTALTGEITDQAALHGMLSQIRDLGLPLILVELVLPIEKGADSAVSCAGRLETDVPDEGRLTHENHDRSK